MNETFGTLDAPIAVVPEGSVAPTDFKDVNSPDFIDTADDTPHHTHLVEITTKDGKTEHHVLRVGGTLGATAEQIANHINRTNHFRGRAKKIVVKRGGRQAVIGNLAKIVQHPAKAKIVEEVAKAEVEPHPVKAEPTPPAAAPPQSPPAKVETPVPAPGSASAKVTLPPPEDVVVIPSPQPAKSSK